jgi:hypothetical protein
MAKPTPTQQAWQDALGEARNRELVKLLMAASRECDERHPAAAGIKVRQALLLLGER